MIEPMPVRNPATGLVFAHVPATDPADVARAGWAS